MKILLAISFLLFLFTGLIVTAKARDYKKTYVKKDGKYIIVEDITEEKVKYEIDRLITEIIKADRDIEYLTRQKNAMGEQLTRLNDLLDEKEESNETK